MLQICQMKAVRCVNVLILLVCCSLKQLVWGSRQKLKSVLNSSKKGRRGQLVHIEVGRAAAGGTDGLWQFLPNLSSGIRSHNSCVFLH